jgi:hypothetical protein
MIGIITGCGLLAIFWAVIMCKAAAKPQPKPGRDFDERGMYEPKAGPKRNPDGSWPY